MDLFVAFSGGRNHQTDPNRTINFPGTGNMVTICWDSMCTPRCQVTIESQENKNIQDWSFKTKELPVDKDL